MTAESHHNSQGSMLSAPLTINNLELSNRIFKAPTLECMAAPDGSPTDKLTRFYRRAARGGAGLMIMGLAYVNEVGKAYQAESGIHENRLVPQWKSFTDDIHEAGGKIVMQISHGGRQIDPRLLNGRKARAASPTPNLLHLYRAKGLEDKEIRAIIDDFAAAAARVKEAGFDGIQIHSSGGYLLAGFLSPLTNRRKDEWGGDDIRRFHLFEEIYKGVRDAVGNDFPIFAKIHLGDFLVMGRPFPANYNAALRMQEIGIDALEFAVGIFENSTITFAKGKMPIEMIDDHVGPIMKAYWRATGWSYKPFTNVKKPYFVHTATQLKKAGLTIPLLLAGGVRRYDDAEDILQNNTADLIGMARPLLHNPDLPNLWLQGNRKESGCVSCNKCTVDMGINANPLKCHSRDKKSRL